MILTNKASDQKEYFNKYNKEVFVISPRDYYIKKGNGKHIRCESTTDSSEEISISDNIIVHKAYNVHNDAIIPVSYPIVEIVEEHNAVISYPSIIVEGVNYSKEYEDYIKIVYSVTDDDGIHYMYIQPYGSVKSTYGTIVLSIPTYVELPNEEDILSVKYAACRIIREADIVSQTTQLNEGVNETTTTLSRNINNAFVYSNHIGSGDMLSIDGFGQPISKSMCYFKTEDNSPYFIVQDDTILNTITEKDYIEVSYKTKFTSNDEIVDSSTELTSEEYTEIGRTSKRYTYMKEADAPDEYYILLGYDVRDDFYSEDTREYLVENCLLDYIIDSFSYSEEREEKMIPSLSSVGNKITLSESVSIDITINETDVSRMVSEDSPVKIIYKEVARWE